MRKLLYSYLAAATLAGGDSSALDGLHRQTSHLTAQKIHVQVQSCKEYER